MAHYFYEISVLNYGLVAGICVSLLLFGLFFKKHYPVKNHRSSQSGNIFFTMFGAVALVGAVGAASMTVMKGPVRTMAEVTKRTIAENNMIASGKLAIIAATTATAGGDCDMDGTIEPVQFIVAAPNPAGGGQLPPNIGASIQDPWKTNYGYCIWDHGTTIGDTGADCIAPVASNNRLIGENPEQPASLTLVIISAGPDRIFQTSCNAYPTATPVDKPNGSDDLILKYTYAEASSTSGGLWNLKGGSPGVAEIQKNLEVKDAGGIVTFSLDKDTGIGEFMAIKADNIYPKAATVVQMGAPLRIQSVGGAAAPTIGAGGGATVLDELTDVDTAGKGINDVLTWDGGNWVHQGITESDPQVGTLTNTKWCTTNGTLIACTSNAPVLTEVDPQVSSVSNNQWCRGTGTAVTCDQTDPVVAATNGQWCRGTGAAVTCDRAPPVLTEVDPQVGTLTNTKWCTTDGTVIDCTSDAPGGATTLDGLTDVDTAGKALNDVLTWDGANWVDQAPGGGAETDPQVGTLTNTKWCTTNGTVIDCTSDAPGGGSATFNEYTTAGTHTWNKPGSGSVAKVQCWGGGGGGGGGPGSGPLNYPEGHGGGGSGSQYVEGWFLLSSLSASVTITVGSGGAGGAGGGYSASGNDGSDGSASSFGGYISASGGAFGELGSVAVDGAGGLGVAGNSGGAGSGSNGGRGGWSFSGSASNGGSCVGYRCTGSVGSIGNGYGGGGGGGSAGYSSGGKAGGAGSDGACRIVVF